MFVNASECAALLGVHPYSKMHEAFEKVWRRTDKPGFAAALARNGAQTTRQRVQAIVDSNEFARRALDRANRCTHASAAAVLESLAEDARDLAELGDRVGGGGADTKLVAEEIRKVHFTQYGTQQESGVLTALAECGDLGDIVPGDGAYHSRPLGIVRGGGSEAYTVSVGGKIDGMTRDGSAVIEVKNRVNRLFNAASEYERVQCMCYLALFPAAQKCVLAEGLRADGTLTVNLVDIPRDEAAWEDTRRAILRVADLIARVVEDPAVQDAYFASKTKTAFLKKRVRSD